MSIRDTSIQVPLESQSEDVAAFLIKSIAGIVPFGSVVGEALSIAIPNQKASRVIEFVRLLNEKLEAAEVRLDAAELRNEEFCDLLEDGVRQAARAMSKERIEHIAAVVKHGITSDDLEHLEKKKVLALLEQINDAEVVWLTHHAFRFRFRGNAEYDAFYARHTAVLKDIGNYVNPSEEIRDKYALRKSYVQHLLSLGLIGEKFDRVDERKGAQFDPSTGKLKSRSIECTQLGRIVLRYLDCLPTD